MASRPRVDEIEYNVVDLLVHAYAGLLKSSLDQANTFENMVIHSDLDPKIVCEVSGRCQDMLAKQGMDRNWDGRAK